MSKSNRKPVSTKGGIALSADAREKLQHLANWIEEEIHGNQDPHVRLDYIGAITVRDQSDATHLSPMGALVQMFKPFKPGNLKPLLHGFYVVTTHLVYLRAAGLLGINMDELYALQREMFKYGYDFPAVVRGLRDLK